MRRRRISLRPITSPPSLIGGLAADKRLTFVDQGVLDKTQMAVLPAERVTVHSTVYAHLMRIDHVSSAYRRCVLLGRAACCCLPGNMRQGIGAIAHAARRVLYRRWPSLAASACITACVSVENHCSTI